MAEEEKCDSCEMAILGGMALNICKTDVEGLDCEQMTNDFVDGKITIADIVARIREKTVDPEVLKKLDEVEGMAKGDREG